MSEEQPLNPNVFPIVLVVWRDHSYTAHPDGPWMELKEALELSGVVRVHEVGYLLSHTPSEIKLASCLTDDDGTKGITTILPEAIERMEVLVEGELNGN